MTNEPKHTATHVIKSEWDAFCTQPWVSECDHETIEVVRVAFYAGAAALFTKLNEVQQSYVDFMMKVCAEMVDFMEVETKAARSKLQ